VINLSRVGHIVIDDVYVF